MVRIPNHLISITHGIPDISVHDIEVQLHFIQIALDFGV